MRVVDLFAGCGGMSLGFALAGFDILAAFDNWQPACLVYQANFTHPIHCVDLAEPESLELLQTYTFDVLIGGPPCQDFSSAGKRDETLGRADLTLTFANIVAQFQPRYFVMENVPRIIHTNTLMLSKQKLKSAGYGLSEQVLLASLCGVPQDRKRYFLLGELGGDDTTMIPYLKKHLADKPMTVFDYLGNALNTNYYYRHPRNYSRRAIYSVHEPSPTIRGVNRPIPKGYQGHPLDASPLTDEVRPLTTKERSRIQTFPETFHFEGTRSNVEQMIGNAVPVEMARFVAKALQSYHQDKMHNRLFKKPRQLTLL